MDKRLLTGNWYLKIVKRSIFSRKFTYLPMVEVKVSYYSDPSYGNGLGSYSPEVLRYEVATPADLINLGIEIQ